MQTRTRPDSGQKIVLEPEGLLGTVLEALDGEHFVFDSIVLREVVPVASDRWRALMSRADGAAVEERIARAHAIPELAWRPEFAALRWESPEATLLRAHLEGTRDQRITGYATLLDWSLATGVLEGVARGLLASERDFLLGELAVSSGSSDADLVRRLRDRRAPAADRVSFGAPASMPPPPRVRIEDPGWLPGPPATHALGAFDVDRALTIVPHGWALAGPDRSLEEVEGSLVCEVARGRWTATLVIQPETLPDDLEAWLTTRFSQTVLLTVLRRSWLVLTHESARAGVPEVVPEADRRAWVDRLVASAESDGDPLDDVALKSPDGSPLTCAGHVEPSTGRVAVVGRGPWTRVMTSALRATEPLLAAGWEWGVTYRCGRAHALPVFEAGLTGRRTLIALPSSL